MTFGNPGKGANKDRKLARVRKAGTDAAYRYSLTGRAKPRPKITLPKLKCLGDGELTAKETK